MEPIWARRDRVAGPRRGLGGPGANLCIVLLIDTANVVGSRPTGWWRDPAGAARQLVDRVRSATANSQLPLPVVMVLEGVARQGVEEGVADGVEIVHAPRGGDDTLARLAGAGGEDVILVSADRALGARVGHAGGKVVGPNWLLARLGPDP
jgi:hypothetical protein